MASTESPSFPNHSEAVGYQLPLPEYIVHRDTEVTMKAERRCTSGWVADEYVYTPTDQFRLFATMLVGSKTLHIATVTTKPDESVQDGFTRLAKKARKEVDIRLLDAEQRGTITARVAARLESEGPPTNTTLADVLAANVSPEAVLGRRAWVWGMNRWRRGMVTKVAKTKATVAYTTPSSNGRIYRPSRPMADIYVELAGK